MPEPFDVAGDFRLVYADSLREVQYRAYDPAADAHGPAEECVGVRGVRKTGWDNGRSVPAVEWTVTGTAEVPVVGSLIVDGAETWVVRTVESDPVANAVHVCGCVAG